MGKELPILLGVSDQEIQNIRQLDYRGLATIPEEFLEDIVDYNGGSNVIPLGYSCYNDLFEIKNVAFHPWEFKCGKISNQTCCL